MAPAQIETVPGVSGDRENNEDPHRAQKPYRAAGTG